MWPFKRTEKKEIWSETAIALYEKQMAAREALGTAYICHPTNDSPRLKPQKMDPSTVYYQGYDALRLEAMESVLQTAEYTWKQGDCVLEDHTVIPPRILRLVK